MTTLSLREAAEATDVSKSTIFRAIKAGRLSAGRDDDGNFAIDPAELFRVYEPKGRDVPKQAAAHVMDRDAQAPGTDETAMKLAIAEAQLAAIKELLAAERERTQEQRERAEEFKAERDRWATQAERVLLQGPARRTGWWPFRRAVGE